MYHLNPKLSVLYNKWYYSTWLAGTGVCFEVGKQAFCISFSAYIMRF